MSSCANFGEYTLHTNFGEYTLHTDFGVYTLHSEFGEYTLRTDFGVCTIPPVLPSLPAVLFLSLSPLPPQGKIQEEERGVLYLEIQNQKSTMIQNQMRKQLF